EPDYTRIPNEVSHQIIHHSASQNDLTDYTNLVRSIYLYHTEVNGWSDMGYNYLIAPDGSVFAGRDPGENLSQDAVLGAHFCGSNSSTMGICMLGTYSEQAPTAQALQALEQLIAWKSAKEILDPLAFLPHTHNQNLGTIAGHRDGCATLCPGDSLYALLPLLRQKTLDQLHGCGIYPFVPESQAMTQQLQLFPNPVTESGFTVKSVSDIQEIAVYSIDGKQLKKWSVNQKEVTLSSTDFQTGGVFLLKVRLYNQHLITRKLIIHPF
ncbi:MAG: N-acetylmuramoyl-L-alanine amidase, partial [Bacteroidales bacterium]|nr:N-acetylmuramoyl-L-alanine amidase [Bacteroidales bacterium]